MTVRNVNVRLSASGGDVFVRIFQEAGRAADKALNGILGPAAGVRNIIASVGAAARVLGPAVLTMAGALAVGTKAAAEEEFALARLNAILKATGNSAGVIAVDIQAMAAKISGATLASKEDVLEAARALATFGGVGRENFEAVLVAAQDVAAATGESIVDSARKLGRLFQDPVAAVGQLNRSLGAFSPAIRDAIEKMAKTGDVTGAAGLALKTLQDRIGGLGAAEADTTIGSVKQLTKAWGEVLEALGKTGPVKAAFDALTDLGKAAKGAVEGPDLDARIAAARADLADAEANAASPGGRMNRFQIDVNAKDIANKRRGIEALLDEARSLEAARATADRSAEQSRAEAKTAIDDAKAEAAAKDALKLSTEAATKAAEAEREEREKAHDRARKLIADFEAVGRGYDRELDDNERLIAALRTSNTEYEKTKTLLEILAKYRDLGMPLSSPEDLEAARALADTLGRQRETIDDLKAGHQALKAAARDSAHAISGAFEDAVLEGKAAVDVFNALVLDVERIIFRLTVTKPLETVISSVFTGFTGSAHGNVFAGGNVVPFARGGVVSRPTVFPMARGAGLMGEAGPEAILPLARLSGGDLGVKAAAASVKVEIFDQRSGGAPIEVAEIMGPLGPIIRIVARDEVAKGLEAFTRRGGLDAKLRSDFGLARQPVNRG